MAQVTIAKSTVIANRDAGKPNDLRTAGRNFQKRAIAATVAADSAGSMYGFFSLPSNAVVTSCEFSCGAMGTSASIDLGLWETEQHGGFSATTGWLTLAGGVTGADQFFGDAIDTSGALAKAQKQYSNTNFYTLANADQMIWQVLGLAADPAQSALGSYQYDVVAVCEVAIPNAISMLLEIAYKMQ